MYFPYFSSTLLYFTVLYCTLLCCTVLYCTALYCTSLYCTVLCCTVLCCTLLSCTVLYCTVLYYSVVHTVLFCSILYYYAFIYSVVFFFRLFQRGSSECLTSIRLGPGCLYFVVPLRPYQPSCCSYICVLAVLFSFFLATSNTSSNIVNIDCSYICIPYNNVLSNVVPKWVCCALLCFSYCPILPNVLVLFYVTTWFCVISDEHYISHGMK